MESVTTFTTGSGSSAMIFMTIGTKTVSEQVLAITNATMARNGNGPTGTREMVLLMDPC